MTAWEKIIIIESFIHEAANLATVLISLVTFIIGLHLKQPWYLRRKNDSDTNKH
jgi:hypothetical protein